MRRGAARRAAATAVAGLAVVTAACGGERLSPSDYQQRLNGVEATLAGSLRQVAVRGVGRDADGIADEIEEVARAVERTAHDLDELDPPADANEAHDRLVRGLRRLADDLVRVADDVRDGDVKALTDLVPERLPAGEDLEAAAADLRRAGYEFGG